jgi:transposase-like protein
MALSDRLKRWRAKNHEKVQAHRAVRRALLGGRLAQLPCEVCDEPKSEAHHDDYSQPLVVRWLCHAHHFQVHGTDTPVNGDKDELYSRAIDLRIDGLSYARIGERIGVSHRAVYRWLTGK